MPSHLYLATRWVLLSSFVLIIARETIAQERVTGPWEVEQLHKTPEFTWEKGGGPVRSLLYAGENHGGRGTRVFAYYASPATLSGDSQGENVIHKKYPGVVLVHGGGGTAFRQWAELWAKRGYAAIAMDLAGQRPLEGKPAREPLPDGGPDQSDLTKFGHLDEPVTEHWPYHAVANVIRGHSLLRSFPEVDADKTAVTGISWGGYLTCIVASLDNRFKAAVPVYGCGFLHENSYWVAPNFEKMTPAHRERWVTLYDPSRYLGQCRVPILFVNGTNDFAYPLDSYMKSYQLVPGEKNIRVTVNMPHGHEASWEPLEIGAFIDQHLLGTSPLPKITNVRLDENGDVIADILPPGGHYRTSLAFTKETGAINKRKWTSIEATSNSSTIRIPRPPQETTAWFLNVTDAHGWTTSSEVRITPKSDDRTDR